MKEVKVTLTLNEEGEIIDVEPHGQGLKIHGKKLGNNEGDCKFQGEVSHMTTATIICKTGHSPCCIVHNGRLWCWC